jgi:uncharacterized protein
MQDFILSKREQIGELCRTHHVRRLSVFGSATRDDFDPEHSDVDVRVEFYEEANQSYVQNLHSFHDSLTDLFGRPVDLLSATRISNRFFEKELQDTQVVLYAA